MAIEQESPKVVNGGLAGVLLLLLLQAHGEGDAIEIPMDEVRATQTMMQHGYAWVRIQRTENDTLILKVEASGAKSALDVN